MTLANLPDEFIENIVGMDAEAGKAWLSSLPELIARIESDWRVSVEDPFPNLSFNFVAPCSLRDGRPGVIKIGHPGGNAAISREARLLGLIDGRIAPRLFAESSDPPAILMERVMPGTSLKTLLAGSEESSLKVGIDLLQRFSAFDIRVGGFEKVYDWFEVLETQEASIVPEEYRRECRVLIDQLYKENSTEHILHGDYHHENILESVDGSYKLIDCEGAIGPIEYDIAVFLNEHRRLAGLTGKEQLEKAAGAFARPFTSEPGAICEWAFCQKVLSVCWGAEDFGEFEPSYLEEAGDWLETGC